MFREMEAARLPDPEYRTVEFMVYAMIKNQKWVENQKASTSVPSTTQISTQVTPQVGTQVKLEPDRLASLLDFCSVPKSRREMQGFCGIKTTEYFRKNIIKPMLNENLIKQTIPDKPNSRLQKYIKA